MSLPSSRSSEGHFGRGRMRALLVDDDPATLRMMAQVLSAADFASPTLLCDPRELPALLTGEPFDLLILDLAMPYVDGWSVIETWHQAHGDDAPPILVVTGDTRKRHQVQSLYSGACDFLAKPFDPDELVARALGHVNLHRRRVALTAQKLQLESLVEARTSELRRSHLEIARLLGRAAEFRDNETGAHILRMSRASALLAGRLGWSGADCELLLNASPLHDIGKIAVPDQILLKPAPLDAAEWAVMRTHTTMGAAMLASGDNAVLRMAADIALCHHEKWDGSGYPQGRAGVAIPESARIVAVADVFDALRSQRPYKPAWTVEASVAQMRSQAGRHFDPQVLEVFLESVDEIEALRLEFADDPASDGGSR